MEGIRIPKQNIHPWSQLVDELEGKKRSECGKSNEKRDVDNENQTL